MLKSITFLDFSNPIVDFLSSCPFATVGCCKRKNNGTIWS